jgi:D-alanine-D-alanine ligase
MKRIGVLMGGWGEEREVSVKTGEAIVAALETRGHAVTRIFAGPGLDQALRASPIDVAFLALHGRMGEDGKVQGLLEVLGIPYTGSGVLASAMAMHKPTAKTIFRMHNLPTACGYTVTPAQLETGHGLSTDLGFPCVVKPAAGGSSVGVTLVKSADELEAALREACRFGGEALVERWVQGRELTVGLLDGVVLGSCEISYPTETFDYARKYQGGSSYHLPPRLPATRLLNVETLAQRAYRALGCRGYARVDLISSELENDVLLEVNTLPGLTRTSLLPKIARAAGLSFEDLVGRVLSLASLDPTAVIPATSDAGRQPSTRDVSSRTIVSGVSI